MLNTMAATPSIADIAAITRSNNNDGFGDGGWWAWILLAMFFGWGGYGNGGWGGNSGGTSSEVQRGFDTSTIVTKLDGITNGISNLGYDQLSQMNGIQNTVMQTGWNLQQAINSDTIANMQNTNALATQLSNCCCENKQQIAELKYDMATSDCSIKTLISQLVTQLQYGQQQGLRDLMDLINNKFCALEMSQKDQLITQLTQQLNNCGRDGALQALYNQLVNTLRPQAMPAYPASNPNGMGNWAPQAIAGTGANGWSTNTCSCCGY